MGLFRQPLKERLIVKRGQVQPQVAQAQGGRRSLAVPGGVESKLLAGRVYPLDDAQGQGEAVAVLQGQQLAGDEGPAGKDGQALVGEGLRPGVPEVGPVAAGAVGAALFGGAIAGRGRDGQDV